MRFSVGDKVRVIRPYSGGNFVNGDVVTIAQIGNEDDMDCYGAISPHDKRMWFLNEDEVMAATNADRIRAMNDEELAIFLDKCENRGYLDSSVALDARGSLLSMIDWLKQPVEEE